MNWLQKASQSKSPPPSYVDIGHGYEWTGTERKQKWELGKSWSSLLWWYENGQIISEPRSKSNTAHWLENAPAKGRIDVDQKIGSVEFGNLGEINHRSLSLKQQIIEKLRSKFPEVKFYVYERGGPYDLDGYTSRLYNE